MNPSDKGPAGSMTASTTTTTTTKSSDKFPWWNQLFYDKYIRLILCSQEVAPHALHDLLSNSTKDPESGMFFPSRECLNPRGAEILSQLLDPTVWAAVMATMSRQEQRQNKFLRGLFSALDPTLCLRQLEGEPAIREKKGSDSRRPSAAKKKKVETDDDVETMPNAYAFCATISLLSFRMSILLSHKYSDPSLCGKLWSLVADRVLDYIAPELRDPARTKNGLDVFQSVLDEEKREADMVEIAATAVAWCIYKLRYVFEDNPSSFLERDFRVCLQFAIKHRSLAAEAGEKRDVCPPPGDLWLPIHSLQPLDDKCVEMTLRINAGRAAMRQYVIRKAGLTAYAPPDEPYNWYRLDSGDKCSIIRTMRQTVFLAFGRKMFMDDERGETSNDQKLWTLISLNKQMRGREGTSASYILGLRKDVDAVLRYAAAVLRLLRWQSKKKRPVGACRDLPSYMLVCAHLQAVLGYDNNNNNSKREIPPQHHKTVLSLSLIAILTWFGGKFFGINNVVWKGQEEDETAKNKVLTAAAIDPYGFRVLLTHGIPALFSVSSSRYYPRLCSLNAPEYSDNVDMPTHGVRAIEKLWDAIQEKESSGKSPHQTTRKVSPKTDASLLPDDPWGNHVNSDLLEMFGVAFVLGQQHTFLPQRLRKINFSGYDDDDGMAILRKIEYSKKHGRVVLKHWAHCRINRFFRNDPCGQKLIQKPQHHTLYLLFAVSQTANNSDDDDDDDYDYDTRYSREEEASDENDRDPQFSDVRRTSRKRRSYLSKVLFAAETTSKPRKADGVSACGVATLPPSDSVLTSLYRLMDDPETPDHIRCLLVLSMGIKSKMKNLPDITRQCHGSDQIKVMKSLPIPFCFPPAPSPHPPENYYQKQQQSLLGTRSGQLMTILMLVELCGLKRFGKEEGHPVFPRRGDWFKELYDNFILINPAVLAQVDISVLPVTTITTIGGGAKGTTTINVGSYSHCLALAGARYYDGTWGSVALGLHEEIFGQDPDPDNTTIHLLGKARVPEFQNNRSSPSSSSSTSSRNHRNREIQEVKKIADFFCQEMLKPRVIGAGAATSGI